MTVNTYESATGMDEDVKAAPPSRRSLLRQSLAALLLDPTAFDEIRDDRHPGRRGFYALLLIIAIVVVARLIGLGLGLVSSPQLASLQSMLREGIMGLPWYAQQVQASPDFATQFQASYLFTWDLIRTALGIPTPSGTFTGIVIFVLTTLGNWGIFALLAHLLARWFGGKGRLGQTFGVVGLSYAPLLLAVVELVPGASVPLLLVALYLLATKYLAIKSAHGLGSGYTLAASLAPYLVVMVISAGILMFGAAYGSQYAIDELTTQIQALPQNLPQIPFLNF